VNQPRRLTGDELIRKVKGMSSASKTEKARACGYYSVAADGSERVCFTAFYEAVAEATGVELAPERKPRLPYEASVLTTGAILIGARYAEQLGLTPGDRVRLEIKETGILVRPV
jgi:hypothetical protein